MSSRENRRNVWLIRVNRTLAAVEQPGKGRTQAQSEGC